MQKPLCTSAATPCPNRSARSGHMKYLPSFYFPIHHPVSYEYIYHYHRGYGSGGMSPLGTTT
jgi:hypothetical protein